MTACPPVEEPRLLYRWKHGTIPVIGLIGGIGSGKSRVARLLQQRGAVIIDADAVGHELLGEPGIRGRILERFGPGVLAAPGPEDGARRERPLDRRALGAVVFADPSARAALEAIVHPPMRAGFHRAIACARDEGRAGAIVLDAAILLEAGWDDLCDRIVFVAAPRPERQRRVAAARGWSAAALAARERAQWPEDRKRRRADWVLTNDAGADRLDEEVDRLVSWLGDGAPPRDAAAATTAPAPAPLGHPAGASTEARSVTEGMPPSPPATAGRTS
jgi:dephospho-CoA kinase